MLQRVDVEMATMPKSAWPQITTRTLENQSVGYCLRRGACPELPEELALQYVEAGLARCSDREFPVIVARHEALKDVATQ